MNADPLLRQNPFDDFTFVFLAAFNEPEDVPPIIYSQLVRLSEAKDRIKIVLRFSRNADQLRTRGKIEFTREYFNNRTVTEAGVKGLSRVWICGPPKMNHDISAILYKNGYTNKDILMV